MPPLLAGDFSVIKKLKLKFLFLTNKKRET